VARISGRAVRITRADAESTIRPATIARRLKVIGKNVRDASLDLNLPAEGIEH
jgi:hypothetical protein